MAGMSTAAPGKFDALYVKMQTEAHKQAVGLFDKYGKEGDDAALVP
jgi:putative membrane protein